MNLTPDTVVIKNDKDKEDKVARYKDRRQIQYRSADACRHFTIHMTGH